MDELLVPYPLTTSSYQTPPQLQEKMIRARERRGENWDFLYWSYWRAAQPPSTTSYRPLSPTKSRTKISIKASQSISSHLPYQTDTLKINYIIKSKNVNSPKFNLILQFSKTLLSSQYEMEEVIFYSVIYYQMAKAKKTIIYVK